LAVSNTDMECSAVKLMTFIFSARNGKFDSVKYHTVVQYLAGLIGAVAKSGKELETENGKQMP